MGGFYGWEVLCEGLYDAGLPQSEGPGKGQCTGQ